LEARSHGLFHHRRPCCARLEFAPVIVFLASDDAAWLTGEGINACGGLR